MGEVPLRKGLVTKALNKIPVTFWGMEDIFNSFKIFILKLQRQHKLDCWAVM